MPFEIRKLKDGWHVFNKDTGEDKGKSTSEAMAKKHLAALYANSGDVKGSDQSYSDWQHEHAFLESEFNKHDRKTPEGREAFRKSLRSMGHYNTGDSPHDYWRAVRNNPYVSSEERLRRMAENKKDIEFERDHNRMRTSWQPVFQGEELFFVKGAEPKPEPAPAHYVLAHRDENGEPVFVKAWMPSENSFATKVADKVLKHAAIPLFKRATRFMNPHQSFGNSNKSFFASHAANKASQNAFDSASHSAAGSLHAQAAKAAPKGDIRSYHQAMGQFHRDIAGGAQHASANIPEENAAPKFASSHLEAAKIHIGLQNAHLKLGNTADAAFHSAMAEHHLGVHNSQMGLGAKASQRDLESIYVKAELSSYTPRSRQAGAQKRKFLSQVKKEYGFTAGDVEAPFKEDFFSLAKPMQAAYLSHRGGGADHEEAMSKARSSRSGVGEIQASYADKVAEHDTAMFKPGNSPEAFAAHKASRHAYALSERAEASGLATDHAKAKLAHREAYTHHRNIDSSAPSPRGLALEHLNMMTTHEHGAREAVAKVERTKPAVPFWQESHSNKDWRGGFHED